MTELNPNLKSHNFLQLSKALFTLGTKKNVINIINLHVYPKSILKTIQHRDSSHDRFGFM